MSNYQKISVTKEDRIELHDQIGLTGAEISINNLPAGASVPFVHSHKHNEEIYTVLEGKGKVVIDGESIDINEKKNLYRSLCNIREPKPISKKYLQIENEYLQEELQLLNCYESSLELAINN